MYSEDTDELRRYVTWGLLLSLLVHIALAILFAEKPPQHFDTPVFVDIIPESPAPPQMKQQRQIVSTPEIKPSAEPPVNTNLQSEKDVAVAKEQIKHGDEQAGPVAGKEGPAAPASQKAAPEKKSEPQPRPKANPQQPAASEPKLSARDLTLDSKTLLQDFASEKKVKTDENPLDLNRPAPLSSFQPFSRPSGSGARFVGMQGSNDYLPDLPDGDITMLNTKADQFAVFVRRVATLVFSEMRSQGWDVLRGNDIRSATSFAVVRAILSPRGELLSVTLESSSGGANFDKLLVTSARSGTRDPNPPVGARAADGNIHFIFESRSWVESGPGGRSGFPVERRWVLLGTGLE